MPESTPNHLQILAASWRERARIIATYHGDANPASLALNACAEDLAGLILAPEARNGEFDR